MQLTDQDRREIIQRAASEAASTIITEHADELLCLTIPQVCGLTGMTPVQLGKLKTLKFCEIIPGSVRRVRAAELKRFLADTETKQKTKR